MPFRLHLLVLNQCVLELLQLEVNIFVLDPPPVQFSHHCFVVKNVRIITQLAAVIRTFESLGPTCQQLVVVLIELGRARLQGLALTPSESSRSRPLKIQVCIRLPSVLAPQVK